MTKLFVTRLLTLLLLSASSSAIAQAKKPAKSSTVAKPSTTKSKESGVTPKTTTASTPQEPTTLQKGVTQVQTVLNTMYEPQTTSTFHPGNAAVNVGIGLFGANHGYDVFGSVKQSPALSISYEKGISIGGLLGYKHYYYDFPKTDYKASWTDIILMARGTYHYNLTSNPLIDTYAGLTIGARLNSYSNNNVDFTSSAKYTDEGLHLATGIFLGGRYFLTDKLGVFAEAGYDMTYFKFGLTGRF
jgi:hypothetical protein